MELNIRCKRCKKNFILEDKQYVYLKRKAEELKSQLILPKLCHECRIIREEIKSIPMKMQNICNQILQTSKEETVKKDVMLLFGLASKQIKESLTAFGFIDKKEK
jgi:delta-aminolevulinic acid dehydratase/porphobilinogen synthase